LVESQKLITALQIDARGKETPAAFKAELVSFSTRVVAASQVVSDNKKLATTVNGRIAMQHMLKNARGKVEATDELVKLAIEAISKLDLPTPNAVDTAESNVEQEVGELEARVDDEETRIDDDAEVKDTIQAEVKKDVPEEKEEKEVSEEARIKAMAEGVKTSEKVLAEAALAVQTTDKGAPLRGLE